MDTPIRGTTQQRTPPLPTAPNPNGIGAPGYTPMTVDYPTLPTADPDGFQGESEVSGQALNNLAASNRRDELLSDVQMRAHVFFIEGVDCATTGEPEKAMNLLKQSANLGNIHAQAMLERMNFSGCPSIEILCLMHLTRNGDTNALYRLGIEYMKGEKVKPNIPEGFGYVKSSADQGNNRAQYHLALMYFGGLVIPKSYIEGNKYLKLSADGGNREAQKHLGLSYMTQENLLKPDPQTGYKYLALSAEQRDADALAYITSGAIEDGDQHAQFRLAQICLKGEVVQQNIQQAIGLFQSSSNQGNPEATFELARIYLEGKVVQHDAQRGIAFLQLSASQGSALGFYLLKGLGIPFQRTNR